MKIKNLVEDECSAKNVFVFAEFQLKLINFRYIMIAKEAIGHTTDVGYHLKMCENLYSGGSMKG